MSRKGKSREATTDDAEAQARASTVVAEPTADQPIGADEAAGGKPEDTAKAGSAPLRNGDDDGTAHDPDDGAAREHADTVDVPETSAQQGDDAAPVADADPVLDQSDEKKPEPDGIAVAALFAGGAAYYRALRLDERMPGIDVSWLAPGATIESADDSNLELIEERLMSLAAYARRAPEARAPALAMHLALARQRESGDLTEEERIAFTVFHKTLVQLDHFAAAEANRARQAHRKIPRAQPVDIEDTTLELVDAPLAKQRF